MRYEESRTDAVETGWGRNPSVMKRTEKIQNAVIKQATTNKHSSSSPRAICRDSHIPNLTMWIVLRNVLNFYLCKIPHTQKLLSGDKDPRKLFVLIIIARITVGSYSA